jgi:hypothetical protein
MKNYPSICEGVEFNRFCDGRCYNAEIASDKNGIYQELNRFQEEILIRCDGRHSVEDIIKIISYVYKHKVMNYKQSVNRALKEFYTKKIIEFNDGIFLSKIRRIPEIQYAS